jgi:SAM-dependent methyltransferase
MSAYGNLQKYRNPNPLQRLLLSRFLRQVRQLLQGKSFSRALDAGCAEGFVSGFLYAQEARYLHQQETAFFGIDIDRPALLRGKELFPPMHSVEGSVLHLPYPDGAFDLILCTEVLEHLPDPGQVLDELLRVTRRYLLLSVPHEPWFRLLNFLRGKHLHRWGNDPEHLQNWTAAQFLGFVQTRCPGAALHRAFPWLLVHCAKE